MTHRLRFVPFLLCLALAFQACRSAPSSLRTPPLLREGKTPADLVVMNARVFTADEKMPWAQAIAVNGERIAYVGTDDGVEGFIGPNTRVVNAGRQMLTPGFVDNHCHYIWIGALKALMVDLYDVASFDVLKGRVVSHATEHARDPFVLGVGWKMAYMPAGGPSAALLDAFVSDRPVFLMSYDGQLGWLNTLALKRLQERDPAQLAYLGPVMDPATGAPTGLFQEFHAFNLLTLWSREELGADVERKMLEGVRAVFDEVLGYGITAFNDVQLYESFLPMLLWFKEEGLFRRIRARGSLYIGHQLEPDEAAIRKALEAWKEFGRKHSDAHFQVGDSVKLYIDGVLHPRSAWMHEPYPGHPGEYGRPTWTPDGFARVATLLDSLGMQACTHSIGDRGITTVIDGYERAIRANGTRDARHRVDHCELPRPEDRKRMADLGFLAAMHPTHFYGDPQLDATIGEDLLRRLMPWGSLHRDGVSVSFGSDWCAGPANPVYGLLISILRLSHEGPAIWGPDEAVDAETAIRFWTIGSARALRRDAEIGSLEVGKFADFVLFGEDLTKMTSLGFLLSHDLELGALDDFVLFTVVDGRIVYKKPGFRF